MTLSERLTRIASLNATDPQTARDLEVIRYQMARVEGKLLRIAKRRSNWTRTGALATILDEEEAE